MTYSNVKKIDLNKPFYICLEGIDGCGKSTQCKMLYDFFISKGIDCVLTREPGSTDIGAKIREIVLSKDSNKYTDLLLYTADRAEHLQNVVKSSLDLGFSVISDRSFLSSYVYQCMMGKVDKKYFLNLHKPLFDIALPDKVFVLDVPVEVAMSRQTDKNRWENKGLEFFENLRASYIRSLSLFNTADALREKTQGWAINSDIKEDLLFDLLIKHIFMY